MGDLPEEQIEEMRQLWLALAQDEVWNARVLPALQMRQQQLYRRLAWERDTSLLPLWQGALQEIEKLIQLPQRLLEEEAEIALQQKEQADDGRRREGGLSPWARRRLRRQGTGRGGV